jgi:hypothetical protein
MGSWQSAVGNKQIFKFPHFQILTSQKDRKQSSEQNNNRHVNQQNSVTQHGLPAAYPSSNTFALLFHLMLTFILFNFPKRFSHRGY